MTDEKKKATKTTTTAATTTTDDDDNVNQIMSIFTEMSQVYCEISSQLPVLLNFQLSKDAFKSSCLENQDAYKFFDAL